MPQFINKLNLNIDQIHSKISTIMEINNLYNKGKRYKVYYKDDNTIKFKSKYGFIFLTIYYSISLNDNLININILQNKVKDVLFSIFLFPLLSVGIYLIFNGELKFLVPLSGFILFLWFLLYGIVIYFSKEDIRMMEIKITNA